MKNVHADHREEVTYKVTKVDGTVIEIKIAETPENRYRINCAKRYGAVFERVQ